MRPSRFATRFTWVSTTTPGLPKALPRMTFAVFLPTPGSVTQLFHRVRDLPAESFGHGFAAGDEMFGFVFEEAGGTNELFDFRKFGLGERGRR